VREYFDSRAAAAACTDLTLTPRRSSRKPLPSPEELEAIRQEATSNGAIYVKGKTGVTVFRRVDA
jgi:hypothetical protein